MIRLVISLVLLAMISALRADERLVPKSLPADQREHVLAFLKAQESPNRYVPKGAKIIDVPPPAADADVVATKDKPIKQYTVQVVPHRPVPGQEQVTKADVYFYRPSPTKGKQGITIKQTVDLTTGKQLGETEVLTKAHTPVSRDELGEAVAMVREKSAAVKELYQGREAADVRWEYLQMKINRKSEQFEPGDRVLRFVFTANAREGEKQPTPVRVLVNLTKDSVLPDDR